MLTKEDQKSRNLDSMPQEEMATPLEDRKDLVSAEGWPGSLALCAPWRDDDRDRCMPTSGATLFLYQWASVNRDQSLGAARGPQTLAGGYYEKTADLSGYTQWEGATLGSSAGTCRVPGIAGTWFLASTNPHSPRKKVRPADPGQVPWRERARQGHRCGVLPCPGGLQSGRT